MNEDKIAGPLALDEENLVLSGGYLKSEPTVLTDGQCIPLDPIDGRNHVNSFDCKNKRPDSGNCEKEKAEFMPREILYEQILNKEITRPHPCPQQCRK